MRRYLACALALAASMVGAAGCGGGGGGDTTPPAGSVRVTLSRPKVALGSPVEMHYTFVVDAGAPALGARKVFVHLLDADDQMMWTDDHEPPTPTDAWKPGQTVTYTRTMFVPSYPYVGAAKVVVGLYNTSNNERVKLSGEDRGDRSYKVADFDLLPQTENVFLIYKDGWHQTEVSNDERTRVEWQWMKKDATIAFRNPRRAVTLFVQADNPLAGTNGASQIEVRLAGTVIGTVKLAAAEAPVQKLSIPAASLGVGDMIELTLVADKTFVPALEPGATSTDTRELGARVFHAFVQ